MALEIQEHDDGKALFVRVTGKLETEDYERFGPQIEDSIRKHGKVSILVETHDFKGWSAGALWADIKFAFKHFSDIERVAIVGEKKWEKGMATFCKPFTRAEVRFFEKGDSVAAKEWIAPGITAGSER